MHGWGVFAHWCEDHISAISHPSPTHNQITWRPPLVQPGGTEPFPAVTSGWGHVWHCAGSSKSTCFAPPQPYAGASLKTVSATQGSCTNMLATAGGPRLGQPFPPQSPLRPLFWAWARTAGLKWGFSRGAIRTSPPPPPLVRHPRKRMKRAFF